MKDKNLPDDNNYKSVEELTKKANQIIEQLEKEINLENSLNNYQELIKLNNIIEKKFQKKSKEINQLTKEKINKIIKKRMKNKLNKINKDTNIFLKKFIKKQKKTNLISSMKYGLFPGGKKIRSKILLDLGLLFNVNYKTLIKIGAAVECIHAYSLIHDDLPCMDNDSLRRGKPSTHIKFGESTAVLAGNSLLTMSFEILSDPKLMITDKIKINLIKKLSECSGHSGIAGGQYLDLNFENKKISQKKITEHGNKKNRKIVFFLLHGSCNYKEQKYYYYKIF